MRGGPVGPLSYYFQFRVLGVLLRAKGWGRIGRAGVNECRLQVQIVDRESAGGCADPQLMNGRDDDVWGLLGEKAVLGRGNATREGESEVLTNVDALVEVGRCGHQIRGVGVEVGEADGAGSSLDLHATGQPDARQ